MKQVWGQQAPVISKYLMHSKPNAKPKPWYVKASLQAKCQSFSRSHKALWLRQDFLSGCQELVALLFPKCEEQPAHHIYSCDDDA